MTKLNIKSTPRMCRLNHIADGLPDAEGHVRLQETCSTCNLVQLCNTNTYLHNSVHARCVLYEVHQDVNEWNSCTPIAI